MVRLNGLSSFVQIHRDWIDNHDQAIKFTSIEAYKYIRFSHDGQTQAGNPSTEGTAQCQEACSYIFLIGDNFPERCSHSQTLGCLPNPPNDSDPGKPASRAGRESASAMGEFLAVRVFVMITTASMQLASEALQAYPSLRSLGIHMAFTNILARPQPRLMHRPRQRDSQEY